MKILLNVIFAIIFAITLYYLFYFLYLTYWHIQTILTTRNILKECDIYANICILNMLNMKPPSCLMSMQCLHNYFETYDIITRNCITVHDVKRVPLLSRMIHNRKQVPYITTSHSEYCFFGRVLLHHWLIVCCHYYCFLLSVIFNGLLRASNKGEMCDSVCYCVEVIMFLAYVKFLECLRNCDRNISGYI